MLQATLNRIEQVLGPHKAEDNENKKVRRWSAIPGFDLVVNLDVGNEKYADVWCTYTPQLREIFPWMSRGGEGMHRHSGTKWRSLVEGNPLLYGRISSYDHLDKFALGLITLSESSQGQQWSGSALEGHLKYVTVGRRYRDAKLRDDKLRDFRAANGGRIFCEICRGATHAVYGVHQEKCLECHHLEKIGDRPITGSITICDELMIVCANCHDILERARPQMSISELRDLGGWGKPIEFPHE